MPPGPLEIKEKSYLTDKVLLLHQTCQLTLWNFISQDCKMSIQHTCLVKSCYVAAAARYMPAGLMLLSQTPLLFKHVYWLSTAARWMLAGLWPLNQHACCHPILHDCWHCVSLSAIPAGMVSHYQPCLLVWWIIMGHAFWFGTSLSASLLVWCLTIGHAFCCGASLKVMTSGVVSHYRTTCWRGISL